VIDEVRLRQDVLDVKTTNGVFIWKIPDIRRRYRDALDGRTISLYSPPFYTSPHGYRMCVRTYLNGDGIGKGTHMSVFFVLMRSEHDSLLCYPFKQSVRFTLINQGNPSANTTEAFIPDLTSPSFQRPEKDMNVASGFPKFARQYVLHDDNFTKGDTIFIKCQVDLTDLSFQ
jgi:TNF receptor-associated factor 2/TNF receptor-associated factor 3